VKRISLIAVAVAMFVCMYLGLTWQSNAQPSANNAPVTAAENAALSGQSFVDLLMKSEFRTDKPGLDAGKLYAGSWQFGFSGIIGAVGCASCHAEKIYRVRKGDNLTKLAKQFNLASQGGLKGYERIHRRNRKVIGGNPNLIKPDQTLLIPSDCYWVSAAPSRASGHIGKGKPVIVSFANCAVCHGQIAFAAEKNDCLDCHDSEHVITAATAQAKRSVMTRRAARSTSMKRQADGLIRIRHLGRNPFGNKGIKIAVKLFELKQGLRDEIVEQVLSTAPETIKIKRGDIFSQMLFGRTAPLAADNAMIDPVNPRMEFWADQWIVEYEGEYYEIIRPWICSNWSWRPGEPPEEVAPPEEEEPPPASEPPTGKKKEEPPPTDNVGKTPAPPTKLTILPPPEPAKPSKPEPIPLPKIGVPQYNCGWEPDFEWPVYGGFSRGIHGDSLLRYDGTVFTFYPAACNKEDKKFRIGPSYSLARWDFTKDQGASGDFKLQGKNALVGVKGEYIDSEQKLEIETRFGTQKYKYYNTQNLKDRVISDKKRLFSGVTYSRYGFEDNSAYSLLQVGISTEQDLGGTVTRGPNVRESIYTIRGRIEGKHYGDYTPILDVPLDYSQGPDVFGAHPAVGFKYKTLGEFLVGVTGNFNDGRGDNTKGLKTIDGKFSVDLDRVWEFIKDPSGYGKGSEYEPDLTDAEE
jgi:hypothetical protein